MSLEKVLSGLTSSSESTPTDVAMKLLDENSVLMRTHFKNIRTMNKIRIAEWFAKFKFGEVDNPIMEFWQVAYNANAVNMVNDGRKGEKAVVDVGRALMAQLGINPDQGEKKGGLFGKK